MAMAVTERRSPPDLIVRCRGEFAEMPGLCLTLAQAARLWNADASLCEQILDALVAAGFLRRSGDTYMRVNLGRPGL
jgi:hypothetical protein